MNRLSELRKKNGLTQRQLAKGLNVSPSAIGMWESGDRKPSLDKAKEIALYFELKIEDIFFDSHAHVTLAENDRVLGGDLK